MVFDLIKALITKVLAQPPLDYWVEIVTDEPRCTYYFGPFEQFAEAKAAIPGYVEDLRGEGAQQIAVTVKRCQPQVLTLCNEAEV
jgi:hypothetical protein